MTRNFTSFIFFILIFFSSNLIAQIYPDQSYVINIDSIFQKIESVQGIKLSDNGKYLTLQDGAINGEVILKPQTSAFPFNQGLPSWNGTAPQSNSGFKVQMRFPYAGGWSPWLTVGFWQANIWSTYGTRTYAEGTVDIDYVKLNTYVSSWQFKVIMTRTSTAQLSPTLHQLSFFVSDSRTTSNVNITQIVMDNPAQLFIPTNHIYQYSVDPVIGGDICSPTSVSMILKSYNINVDPYQFALSTRDPYFDLFGVWPRVVQNASQYGLKGVVNRYRTWSQTREVLANGGRIAMSLGSPLYPNGHLVMLAGFTADGRPIVHDPAKSNGYSYVFNKSDLSQSWFNKGGIAYTFYLADTSSVSDVEFADNSVPVSNFELFQNYPNPFNPTTKISWQLPVGSHQTLKVYDVLGNEIAVLVDEYREAGRYEVFFNASGLPSGIYICRLEAGDFSSIKKLTLIK